MSEFDGSPIPATEGGWGAIVLSLVNMALKWLVLPDKT